MHIGDSIPNFAADDLSKLQHNEDDDPTDKSDESAKRCKWRPDRYQAMQENKTKFEADGLPTAKSSAEIAMHSILTRRIIATEAKVKTEDTGHEPDPAERSAAVEL